MSETNYSEFNLLLDQRRAQWNESASKVLMDEAKLLVRNCIGFTPPTTNAPKIDISAWAKQKKAGEGAIEKDVKQIFIPISDLFKEDQQLYSRMQKYIAGSEWGKIKKILTAKKFSGNSIVKEATEELHQNARGSGGRTLTGRKWKKIVLNESSIKTLISKLKKRVGMAKSGWMIAVRALGVKGIPAWISKHSTPGSATINLSGDVKWVSIENAVAFAQAHNKSARVMKRALDLSYENLAKRLNATLSKTLNPS